MAASTARSKPPPLLPSSAPFQPLRNSAHLRPPPPAAAGRRAAASLPSFLIQDSSPEMDLVVREPAPASPSPAGGCCHSALAAGFLDAPPRSSDAKDDCLSFVTARVSATTAGSVGACSKISDVDDADSRRSRGSSSDDDDADDECSSSCCSVWSGSCGGSHGPGGGGGDGVGRANKPHQANDSRWDAIRTIRTRDGYLGLSHFRLLDRLGSGDIGCVYLAELSGTRSLFAMKVMEKAVLASRKKLSRAQTEREILQCLDHPFLPTLYAHFETDHLSCLVMEFCPGGDLHALQQRQPGKCFTEKAAR